MDMVQMFFMALGVLSFVATTLGHLIGPKYPRAGNAVLRFGVQAKRFKEELQPPVQPNENPITIPKPPIPPLMLLCFALAGCGPIPAAEFANECSAYVSEDAADELKKLEACPDKACVESLKKDHESKMKRRKKLDELWCKVDPKAEGC